MEEKVYKYECQTPKYKRERYLRDKEKINARQRLYDSEHREERAEYQKQYREKHKALVYLKRSIKRTTRKLEAIHHLGNKCLKCGISYHHSVYDFHHVDQSEKEYLISDVINLSKEKFWAEIDKCQLLCANCHRLEHYNNADKQV